jgi:hypothetical protein
MLFPIVSIPVPSLVMLLSLLSVLFLFTVGASSVLLPFAFA